MKKFASHQMSQHDIHQYYFEKYLRSEMDDTDRKAFEEKLADDPSLKKSFEYYQKNRRQFLEDLLIEQDEEDKHRSLNSWIYLLVSITGIVLAINFYIENRELKAAQYQSVKTVPFYKRLPFFSKKESPEHVQGKSKKLLVTAGSSEEHNTIVTNKENTDIADVEEQDLDADKLLHDTFMLAVDKGDLNPRYYHTGDDAYALVVDSLPQEIIIENPGQSKTHPVLVEFWLSPVNYYGYKFNGKKLVIYGIQAPFDISLVTENNIMILRSKEKETPLLTDGDFHKF